MRNKLMFLVLFSFAIVACENIVDDDDDNNNGKDTRLLQTMQTMSKDIDNVKSTHDPDQDFALKMRIHHRGAINMANYELSKGDDNEVKQMADTIVRLHTVEIAQLDSFLNNHTLQVDSVNGKEFADESEQAIEKLDSLVKIRTLSGDVDHDFLVLMIEHHQSGVEIADAELEFGQDDSLKMLVTKMREGAEEEIDRLEALLDENF